jgi:hypothetical protein
VTHKVWPYAAGGAAVLVGTLALLIGTATPAQRAVDCFKVPRNSLIPRTDDGNPLADGGRHVGLDDAKALTDYRLAIPPENDTTGSLRSVWIDSSDQVAFVYDSCLRAYVEDYGDHDTPKHVLLRTWERLARKRPDEFLVDVRGETALARRGEGRLWTPSALTFIEDGVMVSIIGPFHTVSELEMIAADIVYE